MSKAICYYCHKPGDLRPYGPGGAPLCFDCMKASPGREVAARAVYKGLLDEIGADVVLTTDGPKPYVPAAEKEE